MIYRRRALALAAWLALIAPPLYASPQDDLKHTQNEMEQTRARQAELAAKNKKLQRELTDLQEQLVQSARAEQKAEGELAQAEEKLHILADQEAQKKTGLEARRKELSSMVAAALRLSRIPPEAMVMMPGDKLDTMKAARALKMMSDSIKQETQSLGEQLTELGQLQEKVGKSRDELTKERAQLAQAQGELESRLGERKALQAQLGERQQAEKKKLAQLSKKARGLQDLVAAVQKEEREAREHEQQEKAAQKLTGESAPVSGSHGKLRSFAAARGQIRAPAAGSVLASYGVSHGHETSKGIVIGTRPGARVTAPYDGEVVYAGPFRGYGLIVIIRHSDDFLTLISGLGKIDASVGQFLLEGEPIGAMGEEESGNRLYVELRRNNQPVDPAPWIHGLNKKN